MARMRTLPIVGKDDECMDNSGVAIATCQAGMTCQRRVTPGTKGGLWCQLAMSLLVPFGFATTDACGGSKPLNTANGFCSP